MKYVTRIIDGISLAYSEFGEIEFFIPEWMTGDDYKKWRQDNAKEIKEAKIAMRQELYEAIKGKGKQEPSMEAIDNDYESNDK